MSEPVAPVDNVTPVSHEQDGRILSGVGVDPAQLAETMDARASEPVSAEPEKTVTPEARNTDGTFKPSRGAKRFDQLTHEREEANRLRIAAERERDEWKSKAEAAATPRPSTPEPAKVDTARMAPVAPASPKPTIDQFLSDPDPYAALAEAVADWKVTQALANIDARFDARIEADRASRTLQERHATSMDRGRQVYQDFDAVLNAATEVQFPIPFLRALAGMDGVEHLQYALAKDVTVAREIAALAQQDPVRAGMRLAELVPRGRVAPTASTSPVKPTTQAPAPIQPVGAGSKTTSPPLDELAAAGNYEAYKARRASELRAVARR